MKSKTLLGIDFGLRRIGLARSDPMGIIASPHRTITYSSITTAIEEIITEIEILEAAGVVVGYPVAPDGGALGERCRMVDDFISRLEKKYSGPIYRYDERESTTEAEKVIHKHGKQIGSKKERLDRMAAAVILQRFLDEQN